MCGVSNLSFLCFCRFPTFYLYRSLYDKLGGGHRKLDTSYSSTSGFCFSDPGSSSPLQGLQRNGCFVSQGNIKADGIPKQGAGLKKSGQVMALLIALL